MSSQIKRMVRGDLLPPLIYKARYADPTLVLSDAITTGTTVVFTMTPLSGGTPTISRKAATVVSATDGVVTLRYQWDGGDDDTPGDTDTAGDYKAEFELDVGGSPLTIPTDDELRIRIRPDES